MRLAVGIVTLTMLLSWYALKADEQPQNCRLKIQLVDADSGDEIPGLIRIRTADGESISLSELLDRGQGLKQDLPIHQWFVLPKPSSVLVPADRIQLSAFSGLESEMATRKLDLAGRKKAAVTVKIRSFYNAHQACYRNANTHVHLRKITKPESNRYLLESARADGLDMVFVSYLERAKADVDYITNRYSKHEIESLSTDHVHFGHGQEHRHNFNAGEEGYGHVMLLNIPELIYPVSIGPGISQTGTDGIPLQRGIDKAIESGGSVIWCHNHWGLEDIPNWLAGRLHANNIFDGGSRGSYQHSFYRYWETGIKVPVSTGTDWFIYDFSRVYVPSQNALDIEQWLEKLKSGHSYITNGPLLEFSVSGQEIGQDIQIETPRSLTVTGSAVGRVDFQEMQLVQNGIVIHRVNTKAVEGHYEAKMEFELEIKDACWLALRTPPPSAPDEPDMESPTPLNEYGRELFSHTSATFIDLGTQHRFNIDVAQELLDEMHQNMDFIERRGKFADETEKQNVISVYRQGINDLSQRINQQKPNSR